MHNPLHAMLAGAAMGGPPMPPPGFGLPQTDPPGIPPVTPQPPAPGAFPPFGQSALPIHLQYAIDAIMRSRQQPRVPGGQGVPGGMPPGMGLPGLAHPGYGMFGPSLNTPPQSAVQPSTPPHQPYTLPY